MNRNPLLSIVLVLPMLLPSAGLCENAIPWVTLNESGKRELLDNDFASAETDWLDALRIARQSEDSLGREAESLSNLGRLYWKWGKDNKATGYVETAIKLKQEIYGTKSNELADDLRLLSRLHAITRSVNSK
jgi:hypothetical protein